MVAQTKGQAVAPVKINGNLPTDMDLDFLLADAGKGVDDMGSGDVGIPYVSVLQTNSPQVNPGHAKYVENARAGFFYNTATGEVLGKSILVASCAHERKYVEWLDRDSGQGGYVQDHDIDSDILSKTRPNAKGKPALANTNMIVETAYQYCLLIDPETGNFKQVVIPLKSTMLKKNRRWNNLLLDTMIPGTTTTAPRWLYPYELTTLLESKGENSWFNIEVTRAEEPVSKDVYMAGRKFNELFLAGAVKRAKETDDAAEEPVGHAKEVYDEGEDPFNQA
jgi:hypothetical protein